MTSADKKMIMQQAFEDAASRRITDEESIQGYMESVEGSIQFTFLSVKHEHPDMTLDEYQRLVGVNGDLLEHIGQTVVKLTGLGVPEEPMTTAEGSGKKDQ